MKIRTGKSLSFCWTWKVSCVEIYMHIILFFLIIFKNALISLQVCNPVSEHIKLHCTNNKHERKKKEEQKGKEKRSKEVMPITNYKTIRSLKLEVPKNYLLHKKIKFFLYKNCARFRINKIFTQVKSIRWWIILFANLTLNFAPYIYCIKLPNDG